MFASAPTKQWSNCIPYFIASEGIGSDFSIYQVDCHRITTIFSVSFLQNWFNRAWMEDSRVQCVDLFIAVFCFFFLFFYLFSFFCLSSCFQVINGTFLLFEIDIIAHKSYIKKYFELENFRNISQYFFSFFSFINSYFVMRLMYCFSRKI